jgi:hypothetical protein
MATPARTPPPDAPSLPREDGAAATESTATEARPTREDIAREAYLIYLANGSVDGRADDDWYAAEARLLGSTGRRQPAADPQQAAAQLDAVDTRDRTPG